MPTSSRSNPGLGLLTAFALALAAPSFARAQSSGADEGRDSSTSQPYNGAFVEPSVRASWTRSDAGDVRGWSMDLGLRHSFFFLVGDLRLAYRLDALKPDTSGASSRRYLHTLGPHLAVHPFALFLFGSDWGSYVLSSLYVEIGGGVRGANLSEFPGNEETFKVGAVWSVGAGLDVPLGDADSGLLPWLNVLYRYNRGTWPGSTSPRALELHAVFAGIGLRVNGSLF